MGSRDGVEAVECCIDAGAGWEWEDWCEHRDEMLAGASAAARELLRTLLDGPPVGGYMSRAATICPGWTLQPRSALSVHGPHPTSRVGPCAVRGGCNGAVTWCDDMSPVSVS